jgi:hypothetical protein
MPIVFVHGVAARDDDARHAGRARQIERYLRQYVAPVIAPDPEGVAIVDAYWGDIGARFAWGGASCPPSVTSPLRHHPLTALLPAGQRDDFWREVRRRGLSIPGHLTARAASVARRRLNLESGIFLGDGLHYFAMRGGGDQPGQISLRVLDALATARKNQQARGGEPLVVLSHSMGGQIVYDIVTHFLPRLDRYAGVRIDYWAAAASQIGLFEEMKLFLASDPATGPGRPAPFPDRRYLAAWWNMWDPHDFLSYTVREIVEGVDDDFYDSGLSLAAAHFGCLEQPSFYGLFARKLAAALAPVPAGNAVEAS